MGVNINVDLDVDIDRELAQIERKIRSLNDIDLSDFDLGNVDLDQLEDESVNVNTDEDDIDAEVDSDDEEDDKQSNDDRRRLTETLDRLSKSFGGEDGDGPRLLGRDCCDKIAGELKKIRQINNTSFGVMRDKLHEIGNSKDKTQHTYKAPTNINLNDVDDSDSNLGGGGDNDYPLELSSIGDTGVESDDGFKATIDGREFNSKRKYKNFLRLTNSLDSMTDAMSGVGRVASKLKPSMGKIYTIVATLIPLVIGLGAQFLALGAAMGAAAAAGGLVSLMGLLGGEADTLSGSMENAQEKVGDLKKDLFSILEPAFDSFAPISADLFDNIRDGVRDMVGEIEGLESFGYTFNRLIAYGFDAIKGALAVLNEYSAPLNSLIDGFGQFIATNLPAFLAGVIQFGLRSIHTLKKFGGMVWQVLRVVVELTTILVQFLSLFAFLTPVIKTVANLLGNRFVRSILIVTALVGTLAAALVALGYIASLNVVGAFSAAAAAIMKFASFGVAAIGTAVPMMIAQLRSLIATLFTLRGAIASTGLGLALLAVGEIGKALMPEPMNGARGNPSGAIAASGNGGRGNTYVDNSSMTVNAEGNMDYATQKGVETTLKRSKAKETAQAVPNVSENTFTNGDN